MMYTVTGALLLALAATLVLPDVLLAALDKLLNT